MENANGNKNKQDVMVSNLPLLFSNGNPTALEKMSAEDLQFFIPFLIKCMLGIEPSNWTQHTRPKWWPSEIPWSPIILSKKHQTLYWQGKFRILVTRCYEDNECGYLLQFSAKLQQLKGGFKYTDNWDGTTSMYDSTSGKLLVTFRNENMNYDRGLRQHCHTARPMLLPRLNSSNSPNKSNVSPNASLLPPPPSSTQMVEPPICDIFLCDYCGADFNALSDIKAHEHQCMASKTMEARNNMSFNVVELETKDLDQAKFLWYLSLAGKEQTSPPSNVTPAKVYPVSKKTFTLNDRRYTTIPFSSNLGQSFFKMSKLSSSVSESLVDRYERYCLAKPRNGRGPFRSAQLNTNVGEITINNPLSWPISYRRLPPQKRKEEWCHIYSFNKLERKERLKTIVTGLTKRARHLRRHCKELRVVLQCLKPEEIRQWTEPKPKLPIQHLLQPLIQQSLASLPKSCNISLAPAMSSSPVLTGLTSSHRPSPSPSLVITRPVPRSRANRQGIVKPKLRSPPGLLPLNTKSWGLPTLSTLQPKSNQQFILPDLIPVNRNSSDNLDAITVKMASLRPQKREVSKPKNVVIVDLCSSSSSSSSSSDEEQAESECSLFEGECDLANLGDSKLPSTFVLPPGISITKVDRKMKHEKVNVDLSLPCLQSEQNNNRAHNMHSSEPSDSHKIVEVFPGLKCYDQSDGTFTSEENTIPMITCVQSHYQEPVDTQPIITPLKLGRLPVEKRQQMKQSLLKIQQREGLTKKSPSPQHETGPDVSVDVRVTTDINSKDKRLSLPAASTHRITRRKRTADLNSSLIDEMPVLKHAKSDQVSDGSKSLQFLKDTEDSDEYSAVIEVDLAGPELETCDSSRESSLRSVTPDSRNKKKKTELSRLLGDECKELRRKGLENLPNSDQRVTRCRTKSLPGTTFKR